MERGTEVKTILVKYYCKCGGEVEYLDTDKSPVFSNSPKFYHSCTECGDQYSLNIKYPYTKFVPLKDNTIEEYKINQPSITNNSKLVVYKEDRNGTDFVTLQYIHSNPPMTHSYTYSYEIINNQITVEILARIAYVINNGGAIELKDFEL